MNQPNILHAPWEADGHNIFDAYSVMVASVGLASRTRDDAHEIARLIATAPELLDALSGSLVAIGKGYYAPEHRRTVADAVGQIHAAIAKATGGAQ